MNKIISTSDRLFMAVCGPSCCGKTELIFQMLLRNTFYPKFKSIYYFYQHEQPKFSSIERNLNIFSQSFLDLSSFHSWKTVCLFLTILARKFSMTKSFLNSQLLDVIEILASFTLNITYSNRVNGQEQLISTQPTSFCSNHLETYSRSPILANS